LFTLTEKNANFAAFVTNSQTSPMHVTYFILKLKLMILFYKVLYLLHRYKYCAKPSEP